MKCTAVNIVHIIFTKEWKWVQQFSKTKLPLSFLFHSIVELISYFTVSAIKFYPVSCFRNIMQVNLNTKLSSNCMAGICGKRVHNLKIKWTPFPLFDSLPLLCSKNTSKLEAFHLHFKTFAQNNIYILNICSKKLKEMQIDIDSVPQLFPRGKNRKRKCWQ